jgi:hypothetical protein
MWVVLKNIISIDKYQLYKLIGFIVLFLYTQVSYPYMSTILSPLPFPPLFPVTPVLSDLPHP